ncbi:MAG: thiamine pyrophosphate-binding protein, partial [Chloroflexota bacterium]|nr:thiamine pyrophosphate-binding protein [Chloroflexota bacterium]
MAKALKAQGVEYVFTLCGDHIAPIYEGCLDEGIRLIDFRHEQAAGHAADGWARVTGRPGVALATAGPGVTDLVTAVANANIAPSPMVLIGGRSPMAEWGKGSRQELNHVSFLRPLTRWAATVLETGRIPEYIATAFREAQGPRPGPAFVEIPEDVLLGEADLPFALHPDRPGVTGGGDPDQVGAAVTLLAQAQRPVALSGSGVWWDQAAPALQAFLEKARVPAFFNGMGRGALPADHDLFFALCRSHAFRRADVALVIGTPLDFRLGFGQAFPPEVRLIQLDADPAALGHNRAPRVGLCGKLSLLLGQLAEATPAAERNGWVEELRAEENRLYRRDEPLLNSESVPIHPMRLLKEIRDLLPRAAIVIGDGGDIVTFAARVLSVYGPGRWLDPGPFGCLGVGTGFAIAAKLARPQDPVLLLSGDGSFGFNGLEFDTMVRHSLNVVAVIGNNGAWGSMKHPHLKRYGRAAAMDLRQGARY